MLAERMEAANATQGRAADSLMAAAATAFGRLEASVAEEPGVSGGGGGSGGGGDNGGGGSRSSGGHGGVRARGSGGGGGGGVGSGGGPAGPLDGAERRAACEVGDTLRRCGDLLGELTSLHAEDHSLREHLKQLQGELQRAVLTPQK